jgi:hypothetical protein
MLPTRDLFFSFVVSKVWQMFPNFYQIFEFTLLFFPVSFVATVQKFAQKQNSVYLQELPIYVMVIMCLEPSPLGAPCTHMEFLTNCPHTSNSQTSLESRQGTG